MSMIAPSSNTSVLDRLLETFVQSVSPEAAKRVADFRADAVTQTRIDSLVGKANEGTLSADEQQQYESLVRAGTVIAILQAKARRMVDELPAT